MAVAITSMRLSTPSAAHRLGTQDRMADWVDEQLEGHRPGAGVVAGVGSRVSVDGQVGVLGSR